MSTTTANGIELYYQTTGSGSERLVLTHGSWTNGRGWAHAVETLRSLDPDYEVVTWDRRGHSRSQAGDHPGSRDEDAADLIALVEQLGGPVHLVGNSYGSVIVLTVVAKRPDLVTSAMVHEPAAFSLLDGTTDPALRAQWAEAERQVQRVLDLIETGDNRAAAEYFVDRVTLGPGSWARLPEDLRTAWQEARP